MSVNPVDAAVGASILLVPSLVLGVLKKDVVTASLATFATVVAAALLQSKAGAVFRAVPVGAWTGVQISLLIVAAIYFYKAYESLGYVGRLRESLSSGKGVEVFLAVYFSGFIESMSGYGVSPAVTAPILAGLGVGAVEATLLPMFGHVWAVPFASLGVPTLVLSQVTGADAESLAAFTARILFAPFVLILALALLVGRARRRAALVALASSALLPLFAVAGTMVAALTGFAGLVLGLLATQGLAATRRTLRLVSPYVMLVASVIALGALGARGLLWVALTTVAVSLAVQLAHRRFSREAAVSALSMTKRSVVAVILFSAVAEVSKQAGYTVALAEVVAVTAGKAYLPLVPVVAVLGAFITGSATNSNLLLGLLQKTFGELAGVDQSLVLALQNAGAGLGSGIAPAKISVAASTTGGKRVEAEVFRRVVPVIALLVAPLSILAVLACMAKA